MTPPKKGGPEKGAKEQTQLSHAWVMVLTRTYQSSHQVRCWDCTTLWVPACLFTMPVTGNPPAWEGETMVLTRNVTSGLNTGQTPKLCVLKNESVYALFRLPVPEICFPLVP